jgi:hypothetical protein
MAAETPTLLYREPITSKLNDTILNFLWMQPFAAHREIHLQPESALHKIHQRQPVSRDATFMYSAATTNQRVRHETQIHLS